MSKGTAIDLGLNEAYNDLFSTQAERDNAGRSYLTDISTAEINDFPNHPFHVRMDEEMERLVDSVKERGVLSPVLVRPMPDGGYQMVSGHRRKRAAELAELPTLSCIVRELTDDEATIILVDSNLQREQILPSEKAFAYKIKLDAMKRQGQRADLTSNPVGRKLNGQESAEIIGKESGTLQMALRPAVELSYLTEAEQNGRRYRTMNTPHSNVVPLIGDTPSSLTVSTRTLMRLLDCGKPAAIKIGDSAGARISIGRKVLWNLKVVEQCLNRVAE